MVSRRLLMLLPWVFALGCSAHHQADEVTLKVITAKEWPGVINSFKGKIVAVDVWATWCGPCKENFPHHVEMHKKYAKDGVQCISAAVNKVAVKDEALAFLKE